MAGPFAFVQDPEERKFLNEAFRACGASRSWNALSIKASSTVQRRAIVDLFAEMDMSEHSGYTASWTIRELRRALQRGLQGYKKDYLYARR